MAVGPFRRKRRIEPRQKQARQRRRPRSQQAGHSRPDSSAPSRPAGTPVEMTSVRRCAAIEMTRVRLCAVIEMTSARCRSSSVHLPASPNRTVDWANVALVAVPGEPRGLPKYQAPSRGETGLDWWRQVIESCHHGRSDSGCGVGCDCGPDLGVLWVMVVPWRAWVFMMPSTVALRIVLCSGVFARRRSTQQTALPPAPPVETCTLCALPRTILQPPPQVSQSHVFRWCS